MKKDFQEKLIQAGISLEEIIDFVAKNKKILKTLGITLPSEQQLQALLREEDKLPLTVVYADGIKCNFYRPGKELDMIEIINADTGSSFLLKVDGPGQLTQGQIEEYRDKSHAAKDYEAAFCSCISGINIILKRFAIPEVELLPKHWLLSYLPVFEESDIGKIAVIATCNGEYPEKVEAALYTIYRCH